MDYTPALVLIDTNVLLDCYLANRQNTYVSRKALDIALESEVAMACTAKQLSDVFYLVGAYLKSQERVENGAVSEDAALAIRTVCWAILEDIDSFVSVVGADISDVWLARKYRNIHDDFEDDLLIAAAQRVKADYIVTSDERLICDCPVATITPRNFIALLEAFA